MKDENLFIDELFMSKIWRYDKIFKKKIDKLEKKNIYSYKKFSDDIVSFLENETNPKFRKHKLSWFKEDIFSISLWYDLRALYFFVRKNIDWNIEYLFFDIWDHSEVYE